MPGAEAAAVAELDRIADRDRTVLSVWAGRTDGAAWLTRRPDTVHHAASTLKLPLAVAALAAHEAGRLNLDATVPVRAEFSSVIGNSPYSLTSEYDNDAEPWERLGDSVPVRWLVDRSLSRSSNLATNLLIDLVGVATVNQVYDRCGADRSRLRRGIHDTVGAGAGLANTATAADLCAVLAGLVNGRLVSRGSADWLESVLATNVWRDAIPAGLPSGTYVADKPGWIDECCHDVAVVRPVDETPFVLGIFTTTTLDERSAQEVVAEAASVVWRHRTELASETTEAARTDG